MGFEVETVVEAVVITALAASERAKSEWLVRSVSDTAVSLRETKSLFALFRQPDEINRHIRVITDRTLTNVPFPNLNFIVTPISFVLLKITVCPRRTL